MLVLSRKAGEQVTIGNAITLTVLSVSGKTIKLGFEAPNDVRILRLELGGRQKDSAKIDDRRDFVRTGALQLV